MFKFKFIIFWQQGDESGFSWINIGYLSSHIKKIKDIEVDVGFYDIDQEELAIHDTLETKPNIIGLTVLQANVGYVLNFVRKLKAHYQDAHIVLGNIQATIYAEKILQLYPEVDSIALGEGEETLHELCLLLKEGKGLESCKGIYFRKNDEIIKNPRRPLVTDLDSLCFPDRSFTKHRLGYYYVLGSRGCSSYCTFCDANAIFGDEGKFITRSRSIDNILDEIEEILKNYQCKKIIFSDSTFCDINSEIDTRLEELSEKMLQRNIWINMNINIRSEQINDNTIDKLFKLEKIGLDNIFIGFESGNDADLSLYGKRATVATNINVVELLYKHGILTGKNGINLSFGFINFNPYTTIDRLKQNLKFLKDSKLTVSFETISSRLAVSGAAPITKKIHYDNLLTENLDEPTMNYFPYKFLHEGIEQIYQFVTYCQKKLPLRNSGLLFSYYKRINHLSPLDHQQVDNLFTKYNLYNNYITSLTLDIFKTSIDLIENGATDPMRILDDKIHNYSKELEELNNEIILLQKRFAVYYFKT